MRVLYVADEFYGMSETFRRDIVRGFQQSGHKVDVICDRITPYVAPDLVGLVKETRWTSQGERTKNVLGLIMRRLSGRLRSEIGSLRRFREKALLKCAIADTDFDVCYVDYGTVGVAAMDVLRRRGIPFVVHFHGSDATTAVKEREYRQQIAALFASASALLVPSQHLKRILILLGAPLSKIHVVNPGVNCGLLKPLSWEERLRKPPSVVFLGRLTPKKNPVALIEAFALVKAQIPNAILTIIGDGPQQLKVDQRIRDRGLTAAVKLIGAIPQEEALEEVNRHWVYAQHSVTPVTGDQESFGLSIAEASALELPIVATLHNGIPEQVIEGVTGFLVREYDYEAMAERIVELLSNVAKLKTFGQAGRANIVAKYPPGLRIERILSILSEAAATSRFSSRGIEPLG
jgi:glycosyltransferase involved in cell wall biosynthesis